MGLGFDQMPEVLQVAEPPIDEAYKPKPKKRRR